MCFCALLCVCMMLRVHTQHLALEADQPVLLAAARRTVPVEQLEEVFQDGLNLHLPLRRAAGVEDVYHGRQALQGQPYDPGVLGFQGGLAAP